MYEHECVPCLPAIKRRSCVAAVTFAGNEFVFHLATENSNTGIPLPRLPAQCTMRHEGQGASSYMAWPPPQVVIRNDYKDEQVTE